MTTTAEQNRQWRKKNPEKVRASRRRYYEKHSEEIKERNRKYIQANKEYVAKYHKEYRVKHFERKKIAAKAHYTANKQRLLLSIEEYRELNKEKMLAYFKQYRTLNADKIWEDHIERYYGVTKELYESILKFQGNGCAICKVSTPVCKRKYFSVDHNHLTGAVRGLLCSHCNHGLGNFKDNIKIMKNSIIYLINAPLCKFQLVFNTEGRRDAKRHAEAIQKNRCAICKNNVKLCVDHDHKTNIIRGLLCRSCNAGMGQFKDSVSVIKEAIKYLEINND